MHHHTLDHFAAIGQHKRDILRQSPSAFLVAASMAGAYIGLGIILIFSVAATIDPAWQKLVMGCSFGLALTLVVFAGAELFTGHTMYMTISCLKGKTGLADLAYIWCTAWAGNFIGAISVAMLFLLGGGGVLAGEGLDGLQSAASYKMNSSASALFARAILCNWLVCLALWMTARTNSDGAKLIIIFWCLFAFIASGYEHSVANMTLLSLALLIAPTESITVFGMFHNLFWVTFGNIVGGSVFMAAGYWYASQGTIRQKTPSTESN